MKVIDRDMSKLPKWAQNEISRLTADVEYWKERASQSSPDAQVFIDAGGLDHSLDAGLRRGTQIKFYPEGHSHDVWSDGFSAYVTGQGDFMVSTNGGGSIGVVPVASSVVKFRRIEW